MFPARARDRPRWRRSISPIDFEDGGPAERPPGPPDPSARLCARRAPPPEASSDHLHHPSDTASLERGEHFASCETSSSVSHLLARADDRGHEVALLQEHGVDPLLESSDADEFVDLQFRVWPMRKARSVAWSSTAGFHHRSKWKTWVAAVRLSPAPPARNDRRKTGGPPFSWKRSTMRSRAGLGGASVQEQDLGAERLREVGLQQGTHLGELGEGPARGRPRPGPPPAFRADGRPSPSVPRSVLRPAGNGSDGCTPA